MTKQPKPARSRRDRDRGLELKMARLKAELEQAELGAHWPGQPVTKQRVSRVEAGATPDAATQYKQALAAAKAARRVAPVPA
jgi:hypothetical protein